MHHALRIQEILLNIFGYRAPGEMEDCDLASLARTCRAFKDPALDALWKELGDLRPLMQCLPQVFHQRSIKQFSIERRLTQTERDILQSYTRRVRSILDLSYIELDPDSLRILLNSSIPETLFPNLISVVLYDDLDIPDWLQHAVKFLPKFSPHIRDLFIEEVEDLSASVLVCDCICHLQNLQRVACLNTSLDIDTLIHLSRMPAFTKLEFSLSAIALPASFLLLSFSNLHQLTLRSDSWNLVSQFFARIQLPVITYFTICITDCPSRQELSSMWASIETSICRRTIENIMVSSSSSIFRALPLLNVEDLRPCMAFNNLRRITFNIVWKMGFKDNDLLELVSAWPHLEFLAINPYSGWRTPDSGISPDGLLGLLRTCRSLSHLAIVLNTRGYVEAPTSGSTANLGRTVSCLHVDVLDSVIEAESVPAVVVFFTGIAPPTYFTLVAGEVMVTPGPGAYQGRWEDVSRQVRNAICM